jgi:ribosomal-protein-alanine N-acetyltransferase
MLLQPTPVLEAPPVRLRPFRHDDVRLVLAAGADLEIPRGTSVPASGVEADAHAYVDRQHARPREGAGWSFAIADAATDEAVGQVGLWVHGMRDGRASVGYWVGPAHRGHGWAAYAVRAVSAWGLSMPHLQRLELYVEPWNVASCLTAERAGYVREGLMRSWQAVGGVRRDMYMYSLLRPDLRTQH